MSYFKVEWIEQYLKASPLVVFDIGSHNGWDGFRIKQKYPQAKVIAIEADKRLYDKMIGHKFCKGIDVYNYAVCDKDGDVLFYHNNGARKGAGSILKPTQNILKFEGMSFSEPEKVPCTRLDTFCTNNNIQSIDVIHMDIQGAEYEALVGLGSLRPRMIFLEVTNSKIYENIKPAKDILLSLNYTKIPVDDITLGDELWIYENK